MTDNKFDIIVVSDDDAGRRLDRILRAFFPSLTQGDIEKSLRSKMIRLNGKKATADTHPNAGDEIRYPSFFKETKIKKKKDDTIISLPLEMILFEDADIMVLNKPHGLAVQGGSGMKTHLDQMLESLPKRNGFRPSAVHRLDKDTSGCLLVAKKRAIASSLGESVRTRQFNKFYLALVSGVPEDNAGVIDVALLKSQERGITELVEAVPDDEEGALQAKTIFMVLDSTVDKKISLVLLKPITGRTHQLRVHLEYMGTPILGDPKYNMSSLDFLQKKSLPEKLCLHAYRLGFNHPVTGDYQEFTASLPSHFKEILNVMGLSLAGAKKADNYNILAFLEDSKHSST